MNQEELNIEEIRKDFPIFENQPELIYLDNAATSQKPKIVIDTLKKFMERENASINRGLYTLSEKATEKFNDARKTIAEFINANENEVVFTKNTTESINLLAYTIISLIPDGKDEIVLSEMEHHSNLIPWQEFAKRNNFKLKFIKITDNFKLDLEDAKQKITDKTAVLSVTHISNVLGAINPIKKLVNLAKAHNALTIIDAAQSVQHIKINVKELDCDFLAFSSHKILGPTGIGILYGKHRLLNKLQPFNFGGGIIKSATFENADFLDAPEKFEAGTQNIAEAIASAEAIKYLNKLGMKNIQKTENELLEYALEKLKPIDNIILYIPDNHENHSSIISFNIKNAHSHDVASLLNDYNIAIRAGHHCCMPLMSKLNVAGTCRISLAFYNTKEEIDKLADALINIQEVFNR